MKNILKHLLLGLLVTLTSFSYAQVVPTVVNGGLVTISGKGKLGGTKDGAQWRRYKFARSGSFYFSAYIKSITNSNSSFTGIAFRNETNASRTDGGISCVGLFLENDTLKIKLKSPAGTRFIDAAILPGIKAPVGVKIAKDGNKFIAYYTKSPENSTDPSYVLIASIDNVFNSGWSQITQNFATGTKLGSTATALVNNIAFGSITETNTMPCTNGGSFHIVAITKTKGSLYDVEFNAAGLYNVNIDVKNSSNVTVRNYSTGVTANPMSVDVSALSAGTYTMTLTGESCSGTASKTFTVTNAPIAAPLITSVPLIPISGSSVTFNATGCTSTVNWYRNNTSNGIQGTNASLTVISPTAASSYFAKCVVAGIESIGSNLIEVYEPSPTGTGQSSFVNLLKKVPIETQPDKFSVLPFAGVTVPLKNWDGTRQFPKYPIVWHSKLDNFIAAGKKVWDLGISFPTDIKPNLGNMSGDGVRCTDYILYADPNTGIPYANGIDTQCNQNLNNFVSARPFHRRVKSEGGSAIVGNLTNEQLYDDGFQYVNSDLFGFGDNVGSKKNTGFSVTDIENGEHGRFEEVPVVVGMANNSLGAVTSMYNQAINIAFPDLSHYPLDYINGGYRTTRVLLDGTPTSEINNVITDAWKPESKVTISSRGILNKGLIDFPNAYESSEVSCYASAAYFQGDIINYDGTNTRIINKFGLNRNTEHIVAHTIYATQVRKWYLRKYFNDRGFFTLAKTLCDRANIGLTQFTTGSSYVTNPALSGTHLPRELAFDKTMFVPFEGSYFHHWDRNTVGKIIDGDNGELFAIHLLHQKKTLPQGSFSFIDLYNTFDFKLWTAEISYDGGATWKQEKGTDYILSPSSILHAQCLSSSGIWAVFLARPENTEVKACKLRIMYGGSYKYFDVTPSMWETTNPAYANTPLANLPDKEKDYYYDLIDVTGAGNGGVVTEGSAIVAPTITKNVLNPTPGQSVTLTSSGCQSNYVNKWYDNSEGNLLTTGLSYTVSATNNAGYFAKCVGTSGSSLASNVITFLTLNDVNVFVFVGESNAGSRNQSSTLLSGENGLRTGVRIWNNSNNQLETLNIGVNNNLGENASVTNGWGWEVQIANLRASGAINKDVVIVKTAQGGALIGQYNTDIANGYYSKLLARVSGVKNALIAEGKNPIFHVFYSQGINNAIDPNLNDPAHFPNQSGITYWQSATTTLSNNLRELMGANTKICYMKFFEPFGSYLNGAIQNIVNLNPNNSYITTNDLGIQNDGLHIAADGTRTATNRYLSALGITGNITPPPTTPTPTPATTTPTPNSTSSSISITEPAKPPYYFSNGHPASYYDNNINLPAIHKSGTRNVTNYDGKILSGILMQSDYSMTNDLVWLQNDKVKVGINLLRGAQVAWFSTVNSTKNLVYNGYDGGFQVSCDIYQKPDGYTQNGKTSRFQDNNTAQISSYNTTMGGDFVNNSQSLISYNRITNGYAVKFRPIFYTLNCEWSQTTIEVRYTLEPGSYAVKCEYVYTSFRTDGQYSGNGFDSSALPACFLVNDLTRYRTYTGGSPFTNGSNDDGVVPINNENGRTVGAAPEPVKDAHTSERWSCVYNPNSSRKEAFGIYIPTSNPTEYTKIKQFEVYAGNGTPQGSEFTGGFTYMDFTKDLTANVVTGISDRTNFTKTMTAYIIATETEGATDGPTKNRAEAYRLKTLLGN